MVTPVIMPGILAHGFDPTWFGIVGEPERRIPESYCGKESDPEEMR